MRVVNYAIFILFKSIAIFQFNNAFFSDASNNKKIEFSKERTADHEGCMFSLFSYMRGGI